MSFWKRTLLGRDESSSALPNSADSPPTKTPAKNEPPSSPKAPPPAAVGPPPTATAYTHSPVPKEKPKKETIQQDAPPPPAFHIFTPKPSPEESNDDGEGGGIISETGAEMTIGSGEDEKDQSMDENQAGEGTIEEPGTTATGTLGGESETPGHPGSAPIHLDVEEEIKNYPQTYHVDGETVARPIADLQVSDSRNDLETEEPQESTAHDVMLDSHPLTPLCTEQEEETTLILGQEEGTPLSPKFDFLNNDSLSLVQLQESTSKRRHESLARIHQVDCKLASLQAKLAHESMNRARNMPRLDTIATKPLAAVVERLGNKLLIPPDGQIHSRLCALEAARMKHIHVELPDIMTSNLDTPHEYVRQELQASLQLEASKADKRIGTLVRRFESIAGTVARRHQEEAASRRAALVQVESLAQDAADLDERRALEFLESLRKLRESLKREREERKARDKEVMDLVVERTTELKRALLEAAGSSS